MERQKCAVCDNLIDEGKDVFSLPNTITTCLPLENPFEENEIKMLNFKGCLICGCVQLHNLFDPNDIYKDTIIPHNKSLLWEHHNIELSQFITDNINNSSLVCEIGAGMGDLYCKINNLNKIENYYSLEIDVKEEKNRLAKDIIYIQGNCELYDYKSKNISTIIMSHVFEHLYEPIRFLQRISVSNVNEVFIAIPDMNNLYKCKDLNTLFIQHTFYIDTNYLIYLFNKINFVLKKTFNFRKCAIFYHFCREDTLLSDINIKSNLNLIPYLREFYTSEQEKINNLVFKHPFYICPSGYYGQIVYNWLNETSKTMALGFLDSDINKINKRLSGTPLTIFEKKYVKDKHNIKVLIIADKYKVEIENELKLLNNDIEIYII